MNPSVTLNNPRNGGFRQIEAAHELTVSQSFRPGFNDRENVMFRQSSIPVSLASGNAGWMQTQPLLVSARGSAFGLTVSGVAYVISSPQVRRIATRRIVTGMTGCFSVVQASTAQHESEPMGSDRFALEPETPVALTIRVRHPWPTGIGATRCIDLRPEAREISCSKIGEHAEPPFGVSGPRTRQRCGGTLLLNFTAFRKINV